MSVVRYDKRFDYSEYKTSSVVSDTSRDVARKRRGTYLLIWQSVASRQYPPGASLFDYRTLSDTSRASTYVRWLNVPCPNIGTNVQFVRCRRENVSRTANDEDRIRNEYVRGKAPVGGN